MSEAKISGLAQGGHRIPSIIGTAHGGTFNFLDPWNSKVDIEEVAHALSHICRYTGHTKYFYSVAEHSYRASFIQSQHHAFAKLVHDCAEAYIGDISTPLKQLLDDYKRIERDVEDAVWCQLGANPVECRGRHVKHADAVMLITELRDVMANPMNVKVDGVAPLPEIIVPFPPQVAKALFLERYYELKAEAEHAKIS